MSLPSDLYSLLQLVFTNFPHSPGFISGHVRLRGKNNGSYAYRYLDMIDTIFGKEPNTIEVCSGDMAVNNSNCNTTVDINLLN